MQKITKNNKIVSYKNQIKRLKDIKNKYKRTKCWKKLQKKIVSNFIIIYFNMIYVKSYKYVLITMWACKEVEKNRNILYYGKFLKIRLESL